jgi:hypothetical protein
MKLKSFVLGRLSSGRIEQLRRIRDRAIALRYSGDLIRLGEFFRTDKWGAHWYLQHYQTHFETWRTRRFNLIEIGVGGLQGEVGAGGKSLRTWKAYFPNANIFGIDIYDKREFEEERIKIFQGDQCDERFLRDVVDQVGGVDIVIDDGSHINEHVIRTFEILFPLLRNPGIYAIEDTQTSYWPDFGGSSQDIADRRTIMGYFTSLVHSLNHEEILRESYSPTDFDRHIVAMHFYHNLIIIRKGDNSEKTNVLWVNKADGRMAFAGPWGQTGDVQSPATASGRSVSSPGK